MLTFLLCLVAVGVVIVMDFKKIISSNMFPLLLTIVVVCAAFTYIYGSNLALKQESFIQTIPVTEIEGKFYYEDDGEWKDVLTIETIEQSDTMSVGIKKAPKSLWYWPVEVKVLYLPLVETK